MDDVSFIDCRNIRDPQCEFCHYYPPTQVFFDTAHNEDFELRHRKYVPNIPLVPADGTTPLKSTLEKLGSDIITYQLFPLIVRSGPDTVFSFMEAFGKNKPMSKLFPKLLQAQNDRSFSIFNDPRYFSPSLVCEIVPSIHKPSFAKSPAILKTTLIMLEALGRGHLTLFNWLVTTHPLRFKILHSAIAPVVGTPKAFTVVKETSKQLKPGLAATKKISTPNNNSEQPKRMASIFADEEDDEEEEDDAMDVSEVEKTAARTLTLDPEDDNNYETFVTEKVMESNYLYRLNFRVFSDLPPDTDVPALERDICLMNDYSGQDNILVKKFKKTDDPRQRMENMMRFLLAYMCSPMMGEMADPAKMHEYQEILRQSLSGKPSCEWKNILTATQCTVLKRRAMQLPNIFNLHDTEWSAVTEDSLKGSFFNRTHEFVDERLIRSGMVFMNFMMRENKFQEVNAMQSARFSLHFNSFRNDGIVTDKSDISPILELVLCGIQNGNVQLVREMANRGLWAVDACYHAGSSIFDLITTFPNGMVIGGRGGGANDLPIYASTSKPVLFWRFFNALIYGMVRRRRFETHSFLRDGYRNSTSSMTYEGFLSCVRSTQWAFYAMVEHTLYMESHPQGSLQSNYTVLDLIPRDTANNDDDDEEEVHRPPRHHKKKAKNSLQKLDFIALPKPFIFPLMGSATFGNVLPPGRCAEWFNQFGPTNIDRQCYSRFSTSDKMTEYNANSIVKSSTSFLHIGYPAIIHEMVFNEQWDTLMWLFLQSSPFTMNPKVEFEYRDRNVFVLVNNQRFLFYAILVSILNLQRATRKSVVPMLEWVQGNLYPIFRASIDYVLNTIMSTNVETYAKVNTQLCYTVLGQSSFETLVGVAFYLKQTASVVDEAFVPHFSFTFMNIVQEVQQELHVLASSSPGLFKYLVDRCQVHRLEQIIPFYKIHQGASIGTIEAVEGLFQSNGNESPMNLFHLLFTDIDREGEEAVYSSQTAIPMCIRVYAILGSLHYDLMSIMEERPLDEATLVSPWICDFFNFKSVNPFEASYAEFMESLRRVCSFETLNLDTLTDSQRKNWNFAVMEAFTIEQMDASNFFYNQTRLENSSIFQSEHFHNRVYQSNVFRMFAILLAAARLFDTKPGRKLPRLLRATLGGDGSDGATSAIQWLIQRWYPNHFEEIVQNTVLLDGLVNSRKPGKVPAFTNSMCGNTDTLDGSGMLNNGVQVGAIGFKYLTYQLQHWSELTKMSIEQWNALLTMVAPYLTEEMELVPAKGFFSYDEYYQNLWYTQTMVIGLGGGWNYLLTRCDMNALGFTQKQTMKLRTARDVANSVMEIPNNLLALIGKRTNYDKREAMITNLTAYIVERFPSLGLDPVKTAIGDLMVYYHIIAQHVVLSLCKNCYWFAIRSTGEGIRPQIVPVINECSKHIHHHSADTSLMEWVIMTDSLDLMDWLHTTFFSPKVTTVEALQDYMSDIDASSDVLAHVERINRLNYFQNLHKGHKRPGIINYRSLLLFATSYNSPQAFKFIRTNYMIEVRKRYFTAAASFPPMQQIVSVNYDNAFKFCTHLLRVPTQSLWVSRWVVQIGESRQNKHLKKLTGTNGNHGPIPLLELDPTKTSAKALKQLRDQSGDGISDASSMDTSELPHRRGTKRLFQGAHNALDLVETFEKLDQMVADGSSQPPSEEEEEVEQQQPIRGKRPRVAIHYPSSSEDYNVNIGGGDDEEEEEQEQYSPSSPKDYQGHSPFHDEGDDWINNM